MVNSVLGKKGRPLRLRFLSATLARRYTWAFSKAFTLLVNYPVWLKLQRQWDRTTHENLVDLWITRYSRPIGDPSLFQDAPSDRHGSCRIRSHLQALLTRHVFLSSGPQLERITSYPCCCPRRMVPAGMQHFWRNCRNSVRPEAART